MHGNNTGKSQVRDQLQGEDFATLDASLIGTAGGRVFLNPKTGNDQTAVITIAETFRGVHLPSLGQFIPQSGEFVSATVADTPAALVSPSNNEVYRIDNISVANNTLGSLTAVVTLTDSIAGPSASVLVASQAIGDGDTTVITLPNPIYVDKNAVLAVSASGASLAYSAFVYKVVQ
jgi:hypothetical protein